MKEQIISALNVVIEHYGKDIAKTIEQLFRNETRHFESENFAITFSPGMEAFTQNAPYGWPVVDQYWHENSNYAPVGVYDEKENNSAMANSRGIRHFVKFANIEAAMMSVAFIIHQHGGDGGSWFSIADKQLRNKYNEYLTHIIPRFVNSIN